MVSFCPFNQFLDITNSKLESKHGSTKGFEWPANKQWRHSQPWCFPPQPSSFPRGTSDPFHNSTGWPAVQLTENDSVQFHNSIFFLLLPSFREKKNTYSEKPGQLATSRRRHVAHFWCGSHSYKASLGLVCRWSRCWYMFKRGQGLEKYRNEYQWWFKKCSIWCDIGKMYKGIYVCKG